MSVNNIQANVQNAEQYKIRKQIQAQQSEDIQSQNQNQVQQVTQEISRVQVDEYDKANPVGEEVEGIYSVSHDDAGNLKIDYKQPVSKTDKDKTEASQEKEEKEKETMAIKANEKPGGAKASELHSAEKNESSDSSDDNDDEEELKKLKQRRDAIKQQLNHEVDENAKAALRAQLQSIEFQIALKSSGVGE